MNEADSQHNYLNSNLYLSRLNNLNGIYMKDQVANSYMMDEKLWDIFEYLLCEL